MSTPPYYLIDSLLREGEVIPFLGAGVNLGARRPADAVWDAQQPAFLPKSSELSRRLAFESAFTSPYSHEYDDLAKVASYFEENTARKRLRQRLDRVFKHDFEPCAVHKYLAEVAAAKPLLIVTTNYDDLTERALKARGVAYDLVIHPADRDDVAASVLLWEHGAAAPKDVPANDLYVNLSKSTVVYKIHGTIDPRQDELGCYVITEEDYVKFLSVMMSNQVVPPPLFVRHFSTRHFLFMGYSLRDWNLRVILKNLDTVLPSVADPRDRKAGWEKLKSWGVQVNPPDWERKVWDRRGVEIFNQDVDEFVGRLKEARAQGGGAL